MKSDIKICFAVFLSADSLSQKDDGIIVSVLLDVRKAVCSFMHKK